MKKAVWAILLVLVMSVMAVSCTKSARNSFAIAGTWELVETVITVDGNVTQRITSMDTKMLTYYKFESGTHYVYIINEAISGGDSKRGSWRVDGDTLYLSFIDGSKIYHIEKAGLLRLSLSESYINEAGKNVVETLYLETVPTEQADYL